MLDCAHHFEDAEHAESPLGGHSPTLLHFTWLDESEVASGDLPADTLPVPLLARPTVR